MRRKVVRERGNRGEGELFVTGERETEFEDTRDTRARFFFRLSDA